MLDQNANANNIFLTLPQEVIFLIARRLPFTSLIPFLQIDFNFRNKISKEFFAFSAEEYIIDLFKNPQDALQKISQISKFVSQKDLEHNNNTAMDKASAFKIFLSAQLSNDIFELNLDHLKQAYRVIMPKEIILNHHDYSALYRLSRNIMFIIKIREFFNTKEWESQIKNGCDAKTNNTLITFILLKEIKLYQWNLHNLSENFFKYNNLQFKIDDSKTRILDFKVPELDNNNYDDELCNLNDFNFSLCLKKLNSENEEKTSQSEYKDPSHLFDDILEENLKYTITWDKQTQTTFSMKYFEDFLYTFKIDTDESDTANVNLKRFNKRTSDEKKDILNRFFYNFSGINIHLLQTVSGDALGLMQAEEMRLSKFTKMNTSLYQQILEEAQEASGGIPVNPAQLFIQHGIQICDLDLSNIDILFTPCTFLGANFSGSSIYTAQINNSNYSSGNFSNMELEDFEFNNFTAKNSDFSRSIILKSKFNRCNFAQSDFTKTNLMDCDFSQINFSHCNLSLALVLGASFTRVTFTGAFTAFFEVSDKPINTIKHINDLFYFFEPEEFELTLFEEDNNTIYDNPNALHEDICNAMQLAAWIALDYFKQKNNSFYYLIEKFILLINNESKSAGFKSFDTLYKLFFIFLRKNEIIFSNTTNSNLTFSGNSGDKQVALDFLQNLNNQAKKIYNYFTSHDYFSRYQLNQDEDIEPPRKKFKIGY